MLRFDMAPGRPPPMAPPVFVANAVLALTATALCAVHAWPDRERLALLGTGVVYGVLLEQLVILNFAAYHYPVDSYLITVADVPVVIGLGWAVILYSGLHLGERLGIASWRRPLFVGLFALHIDLAMDAVAIRVGFWTWTPPGVWFGVPLGNFTGWFLVATLFPAAWLGLRERLGPLARGPAAIVVSVAGLVAGLEGWDAVATTVPRKALVLGGAVLVAAVVVRSEFSPRRPDRLPTVVPFLYHGFFLALLVGFGMYRAQPLMAVVSLAMLGVGVAVHTLPELVD